MYFKNKYHKHEKNSLLKTYSVCFKIDYKLLICDKTILII